MAPAVADPLPALEVSPTPAATTTGRTFHVDCRDGRDGANGRRPSRAWQSLSRAGRARMRPGDSLLLHRGCRWQEPLAVTWSGTQGAPITIGAYGDGDLPVIENSYRNIEVTGSWFVIQDIHVRADPVTRDPRCDDHPAGVRFGIFVAPGSEHGVIQRIRATELFTGVRISRGASHHVIRDSVFRDNDMKSDDFQSDSGAVAVDLQGDDNVVTGNRFSGSDACSRFFGGRDGSAVSVYGGRRNVIHHNRSRQDHNFIELGDPRTRDTLIAYNTAWSTLRGATLAVIHGDGSRYGPVRRTRFVHDTFVALGRGSVALSCSHLLKGEDLVLQASILWGTANAATCADGFTEADGIYWATDGTPDVTFTISPSSREIDPRLVDVDAGDLRLRSDSPAIDAVRPIDLAGIGGVDMGGTAIPQGLAPDIGAWEYAIGQPASPPPLEPSGPPTTLGPSMAPPDGPTTDPDATTGHAPVTTSGPGASMVPPHDPTPAPAGSAPPTGPPTAVASVPAPTPTPRVTPTPPPLPSPGLTTVPPPTGGPGALDQLILLGLGLGAAGVLAVILLARRSPR